MPSWFSKKYGPIMPPSQSPHQTVTFCGCIAILWILNGLTSSQIRQFSFCTYQFIQKWVSSLKMIFLLNSGSARNWRCAQFANTHCCLRSYTLNSYVSLILYWCRPNSRRMIPKIDACEMLSFCERRRTDCLLFFCTLSGTTGILSADLAFR